MIRDHDQPIRCRNTDCEHVIAVRWAGGGVKPIVLHAYADKRYRLIIVCPLCGYRNRWPEPECEETGQYVVNE